MQKYIVIALMFCLGPVFAQSAGTRMVVLDASNQEIPIIVDGQGDAFGASGVYVYDGIPVFGSLTPDGFSALEHELLYMRVDCQGQPYLDTRRRKPLVASSGVRAIVTIRGSDGRVFKANLKQRADRTIRAVRIGDGTCRNQRPAERNTAPANEVGLISYALPLRIEVR